MHFYRKDAEDAEMKHTTEDYLELQLQEYDFSQPAAGNTDHAYIPGIHASPHAARVSGMEKPEFDFSTPSLRTPGNCSMHNSTSCIPAVVRLRRQ
jgi:hypothetical protein